MLYIGIDLGTSAVKLLLMEADGTIKNIVSKEYPIYYPEPGFSEQNPEDWWVQTKAGLAELTKGYDKSQISGIGFGGQMHGLVVLDEEDKVIRPAILWNDGRTVEETDYLNQIIGKQQLSAYTANIAFAGFTAPKILWMKKNEPEQFKRIKKIMLPKDYLVYKLTGVHGTDVSDASGTLLFDVKNRCWSKEMLDICHIKEEQMPKVFESYEVVGVLDRGVGKQLGYPLQIKIVAGAGDNAAAAIGTGTVGEGACNISLGTSGTIFISSTEFKVDKNNALHAFCHGDGSYHLMGCILSAASCNKWWMDDIIGTKKYKEEQDKIQKLGENRIYFLPYLMGERSPHNDPCARGTFIGMTLDTKREDMTQAVLERVAFAIRDCFEIAKSLGIKIEKTRICGGGARSRLWQKIFANVLNIEVESLMQEEGSALGGAILAAVGCNVYKSVEKAVDIIVKPGKIIRPDTLLTAKYEEKYKNYKEIYPAVKNLFQLVL